MIALILAVVLAEGISINNLPAEAKEPTAFSIFFEIEVQTNNPPVLAEVRDAFSTNVIHNMNNKTLFNQDYYKWLNRYLHKIDEFPGRLECEEVIVDSLARMKDLIALRSGEDVRDKRLVVEDRWNLYRFALYELKALRTNKDMHFRLLDIAESFELQTMADETQEEELEKYNRLIASMCRSVVKTCKKNIVFYLRKNTAPEELISFRKQVDERDRELEARLRRRTCSEVRPH